MTTTSITALRRSRKDDLDKLTAVEAAPQPVVPGRRRQGSSPLPDVRRLPRSHRHVRRPTTMSNKPPYAIFLDDTRDPNWMRTWMTVEVAIRSAADNRFRFQLETVEGVLTSPQDARERLIKGSVVDIAATVSMCEDVGTEVVVARSYNEFCRALKARPGHCRSPCSSTMTSRMWTIWTPPAATPRSASRPAPTLLIGWSRQLRRRGSTPASRSVATSTLRTRSAVGESSWRSPICFGVDPFCLMGDRPLCVWATALPFRSDRRPT